MKKLALLLILLILSTVYADNADVSLNHKDIVEPNETVEIEIKIKNTSTTYLWKCKASVDLKLLGDEIQYFTIISEPSWDEKIQIGSSINGKIEIKISSDADNVKLRIPIIISGTKGKCACTPFMEGPFYAEITVKNKGIEAFNYAESLYNEGKYEEAMEKYDEAKKYFLNYFDEKNARICLIKAKNCEGHLKLNSGISYFNAGDLDNAKKEFEDAKSIFEDEEMIKICEEWIEKCIPPSTTPPATTPLPTTLAPTTSPPTTPPVTTPLTTSPQGSNSKTIFLILLLIAIASVIIFTIKITKK